MSLPLCNQHAWVFTVIAYIDARANSLAGCRVWFGCLVACCLGSSIPCFDVSTDTSRNRGLNTPSIRLFRLHAMYCLSVLHISYRLACTSISMSCDISMRVLHMYWCIATMLYCHYVVCSCMIMLYASMLSHALRYAYIMMPCSHAILAHCIITCHVDAPILL